MEDSSGAAQPIQPCLAFAQVFYWSHWDPHALGLYTTVSVQEASGALRQLQLGQTHYLPAGGDASGACAALAATAAVGNSTAQPALAAAWSEASKVGSHLGCISYLSARTQRRGVCWRVAGGLCRANVQQI